MARRKNKKPGRAAREAKALATSGAAPSQPTQNLQKAGSDTTPQSPAMEPTYTWEESPRPTKRQKTDFPADARHEISSNSEANPKQDAGEVGNNDGSASRLSTDQLPSELRHLQNTYDFTTMSIISSSKMEQKVRNLLLRTKKPAEGGKPGIVILTAKADVASKLVGIVEIAKRQIKEEGGQWWQYSKLHSHIVELKKIKERSSRATGEKTLREWADTKDENMDHESSEARDENEIDHQKQGKDLSVEGVMGDDEDDDDEGAFQTMGRRQIMAYDENRSKIRALAVLTIYLSQVPVPALKNIYRQVGSFPYFQSITH